MKILDDIISSLNMNTSVRDIRQGVFHTAVLTRNCGLAATLPRDALRQEKPSVKDGGDLLNKSVSDLVRMAYSEIILEASIGMATINSLVNVDINSCVDRNAGDLLREKGQDKRVAIVGHFPFVPELRRVVKELWVIENNPREGDVPSIEGENVIPQAEVVGITGSAFTNHTIESLLKVCVPRAYVAVIGDTTPLCDVLFEYGVDAICATVVLEPEKVMQFVSQGATYRQISGIRQVMILKNKNK